MGQLEELPADEVTVESERCSRIGGGPQDACGAVDEHHEPGRMIDHRLEPAGGATLSSLDIVIGSSIRADHQQLDRAPVDDDRCHDHLVPSGLVAHRHLGHDPVARLGAVGQVHAEQAETARCEDLAGVRTGRVDGAGHDA